MLDATFIVAELISLGVSAILLANFANDILIITADMGYKSILKHTEVPKDERLIAKVRRVYGKIITLIPGSNVLQSIISINIFKYRTKHATKEELKECEDLGQIKPMTEEELEEYKKCQTKKEKLKHKNHQDKK